MRTDFHDRYSTDASKPWGLWKGTKGDGVTAVARKSPIDIKLRYSAIEAPKRNKYKMNVVRDGQPHSEDFVSRVKRVISRKPSPKLSRDSSQKYHHPTATWRLKL